MSGTGAPPPPPARPMRPARQTLLRLCGVAFLVSGLGTIPGMGLGAMPPLALAWPLAEWVTGRDAFGALGPNLWPLAILTGLVWPWFIPLLWPAATPFGPPRSWRRWVAHAALVAVAATGLALALGLGGEPPTGG